MNKTQRKPVTPPEFEAEQVQVNQPYPGQPSTAVEAQIDGVDKRKDLAKVMTNDETPRCPFCLSPRLEPITMENPWGRKWVCNACCTAFREPVKGKKSA